MTRVFPLINESKHFNKPYASVFQIIVHTCIIINFINVAKYLHQIFQIKLQTAELFRKYA